MSADAHRLTVTGDASAVATASAWIRSLGNHAELPPGDVFRLDLCVSELVANIADYGYAADDPRDIAVRVDSVPNGMRVEIADAGKPFDPLAVPPPPLPAPASVADAPVGGFGIHLVRTYADECRYERRDERNVFSFVVRRSTPVADAAPGHEAMS
jgi:anti-sigma regulatory factor (Ser/Thr protein kinase)